MKRVTNYMIPVLIIASLVLGVAPAYALGDPSAFKVFVGYADTVQGSPAFTPTPWAGSTGVTFIGTVAPWDGGAIRIDNPSMQGLTVRSITVDISPSISFNLWTPPLPIKIPGKSSLIVTQTTQFNFDTSNFGGPCSAPSAFKPVVHVTVGERAPFLTLDFIDEDQVLNTGGTDPAACTGSNEGHDWVPVHEGLSLGN